MLAGQGYITGAVKYISAISASSDIGVSLLLSLAANGGFWKKFRNVIADSSDYPRVKAVSQLSVWCQYASLGCTQILICHS
jgi:hypothetical protein